MAGKFKTKLKLTLFLIILCISVGFLMAYKIYNPSKETSVQWIAPNENTSKRFMIKETLIDAIKQKQELISLEIDLTEKITIDDSWGNFEIFKKIQNVYIYGQGIFSLDLSKIDSNKVILKNKKDITILVPKPEIKMLTINEQKTIYETPQNGLLRFGEISLKSSEHQSILNEAKIKMKEKMEGSDIYDQALKASESAIKEFSESLINDDSYNIVVQFQ